MERRLGRVVSGAQNVHVTLMGTRRAPRQVLARLNTPHGCAFAVIAFFPTTKKRVKTDSAKP